MPARSSHHIPAYLPTVTTAVRRPWLMLLGAGMCLPLVFLVGLIILVIS